MSDVLPDIAKRAQEMLRLRAAAENVRLQQQGHGRPIISSTIHGYRVVAVGNTLHWSQTWIVFPDFLLHFVKKTLGLEWGAREKSRGEHPIFRWLEKFQRHSDSLRPEGKLKSGQMIGFIACLLHFAYALYLIAHNDQLPKLLLKRLRDPSFFMPAYYEAIVGAALAVAGFELSCAETKATSIPTPEFRAKSKATGKVYEVEAKRKDRWKASTGNVSSPEFLRELEGYVRGQIHGASKKKLKNPIYWFELSIPTLTSEADWRAIATRIEAVLRDAERNMTIDGKPIPPAAVVVTNHTFLVNEEVDGEPSFALLETLNIDDYPIGRTLEIEAALESYDKYRDIFWMMEAWKIARTLPATFDGTPPELLSLDGVPQRTMKIGDIVEAQDPKGRTVKAKIAEIVTVKDKAMVALAANGLSWIAETQLSAAEVAAAERFTDAVFGKDNATRTIRDADPFDLYDFFLRAHARMTREQADKFFDEHPAVSHHKGIPLKEARIRVAREHTKWLWSRTEHKKSNAPPTEPDPG